MVLNISTRIYEKGERRKARKKSPSQVPLRAANSPGSKYQKLKGKKAWTGDLSRISADEEKKENQN